MEAMKRNGLAVIVVLFAIVAIIVIGGIAWVHYYYLPHIAEEDAVPSQASPVAAAPTATVPPSPAPQSPSAPSAASSSPVPQENATGTQTVAGVENPGAAGWKTQSVVISRSPLICYSIQYPPQLTPQVEPLSSPPVEYFADETANHKSIANGLNGVEITPVANTTAEAVYKGSLLYTLGTSKITDFSTVGGLTGKEFLTPPINGLEPQEKWTIYLDLPMAGNNFALIIATPGSNTYDTTAAEAMVRSMRPSCGN
jgi:hypothetical protein